MRDFKSFLGDMRGLFKRYTVVYQDLLVNFYLTNTNCAGYLTNDIFASLNLHPRPQMEKAAIRATIIVLYFC